MQIDFHHGVTYVVARLAGFPHDEAEIIAYCAQYVDDATGSGVINFHNGAMFDRNSSAHKTLDYRNFEELANHTVWIPFHFLPGNGGKPAGENPSGKFIEKLICKPDSYIAQDMIAETIKEKHRPYGLHRLGITMHVYADTWAHQGFAGVIHEVNDIISVDEISDHTGGHWLDKISNYFEGLWDSVKSQFVGDALPLGHGAALSFPDLPYLNWKYVNRLDQEILRDNTGDFVQAADKMCKAMKGYRDGNVNFNTDVEGLPTEDKEKIKELFLEFKDEQGSKRHRKWLAAVGDGVFSFGAQDVDYQAKGLGSWKHEAIGRQKGQVYVYHDEFLRSNWKNFHDALIAHRFSVINDILPRYNICAA